MKLLVGFRRYSYEHHLNLKEIAAMPTHAAFRRPRARWLFDTVVLLIATIWVASASPALAANAASGNQPPIAGPNQTLSMDEDTTLAILLEGTDPEGDPLSATITDLWLALPLEELVDAVGNPVGVGSTVLDRQLFLTPIANAAALPMAVITYRVHDGTQNSANTATVTVHVDPVNDAPIITLPSTLVTDEDTTLEFVMGGQDIENDVFLCRFTALADPDFGVVLYQGLGGGPFDMSSLTGRDQLLAVPSDIALQWPMSLITTPNQCQDDEFNSFSYWFEEQVLTAVHSPESHVILKVRCINDAPQLAVAGLGTQTFATFTTTLLGSGAFTLPVLGLLDVDGVGNVTGPDPGSNRITITTRNGGTVAVDEGSFPGTTFTSGPTSIVFDAVRATVDAILATLVYTAPSAPADDTLTIFANDNGSNQGCDEPSDGSTCPLVAGVNVDISIDAGGTAPGPMTLAVGTGGFLAVDTTSDDVDTNGNCTLREAVAAANDDIAVDACPAGVGEDIIILPTGTYPLSLGTLSITDGLTIVGAGEAFSRIDGLGVAEVFVLFDPLTLRDVSVIGLDADGDGIRTPVDGQFTGGLFVDESGFGSSNFTDQHLGGTTFGTIDTTDGLTMTVIDALDPEGVSIAATGSPLATAEILACSTTVLVEIAGGAEQVVTCDVTTETSFTTFSPDASIVGEPVTVGVTVDPLSVVGAGPVAGFVTIDDGAGASCMGVLVGGSMSCQLTPTVAGTRSWTATYAAAGFFLGSADSLSHAVAAAQTTTSILTDTPDPSPVGASVAVTWAVTVVPPGAGAPTGLVTVGDGVDSCAAAVGVGGCSLVATTVGPRTLTASYAGDASFGASDGSADHDVVPAGTTTTITADTPDPSLAFQPFQVDVTVAAVAPGSGTPTGNVTVGDGAGASCPLTLVAGSGSCMLTPTVAGTRNLEATYDGDGSYLTSTTTESHQVDGTDYGDAPAPYPVELANDGARHGFGSLFLGTSVDADADGQPSAGALGDDQDGDDDEDGVSFGTGLVIGSSVDLTVIASEPGLLDAWVDFGGDGAWLEAGDRIASAVPLAAGNNTVSVVAPTGAVLGTTVGRFRLSSLGVAEATGAAADGEVEDHTVTVTDGVAPQVLIVSDLGGVEILDCSTQRAVIPGLRVTFDEPVLGADVADGYRVVGAGPDADLSTSSCEGTVGDDSELAIVGVSADGNPTTPTFSLELHESAPSGLVRLIVCDTVEDFGGLALDGDGDGTGGEPFVSTFRVDPLNRFANGDFDRCPVTVAPWIEVVVPPNAILPSESVDADVSTLSGSAQIISNIAEASALAQCVAIEPGPSWLYLAFDARLDALGAATVTVDVACDYFVLESCAGPIDSSNAAAASLPDLSGNWTPFTFSLASSPGTQSALCSVALTADDPGDAGFDAYLDRLSLRSALFLDGFESGDTNAWSLPFGD
ncbi:MAG: Ig-like domain repeat protein [Thermoanaerobaculia bacterium]|nr:Ig-like domain repeat protein [Thermoanaerobaculia bacterium]